MEISEYFKIILGSIGQGVSDFNSENSSRKVFAAFPQEISFTIPLDIHGVLDWDSNPSTERKIEFTLCFYPGVSLSNGGV
jgi:hypothetical protein